MKKKLLPVFITVITFLLFSFPVNAQKKTYKSKSSSYKPKTTPAKPKTVHVRSYTTKKGKYVRSHYRSKPTRKKTSFIIYPGRFPKWKEPYFI